MTEIINSNLSDQAKFRLNEINKIKDRFNSKNLVNKNTLKNLVNALLHLIILTKL